MAARATGSGTISFGLVSIPVRFYVATHSEQVSFNMLHRECGTRIRQQIVCPHCERPVERSDTVKGFQFATDQFVTFSDDDLKGLEAEANRSIDIHEFIPLASVDPIYFDGAHYLGPDKGAEKAYHLLVEAMRDSGKGALAKYTSHGKEHLGLIRPHDRGLVLHAMHYGDEVRSMADVDLGGAPTVRAGEVDLARKLVAQLSTDAFHPEAYRDEYRDRVQQAVQKKVEGQEVTAAAPQPAKAQVIDLMDALKRSLGREGIRPAGRHIAASEETAPKRRPAAAARRREVPAARRRAHKK